MFPRDHIYEKFFKIFGWKSSIYGNIDHIFYGKLITYEDLPDYIDIWDSKGKRNTNRIRGPGPKDYFKYFVINTSVGVGAKGRNNIKKVHLRFRLISMKKEILDPEVISIYPHSISEIVGKTDFYEQRSKAAEIEPKGYVGFGFFGWKTNVLSRGKYSRSKSMNKQYSLPYHVITANASGTGNRAMWEFYRGEGSSAIGQYDLQIFFRIPSTSITFSNEPFIKNMFCIDWNVEVNGRRLIDHDIDSKGKWNMKVNNRDLMDNCDVPSSRECWNVCINDIVKKEIERKKKKKRNENETKNDDDNFKSKIRKKVENDIYNTMIEEDKKSEKKKLLRPLYLYQTLHCCVTRYS